MVSQFCDKRITGSLCLGAPPLTNPIKRFPEPAKTESEKQVLFLTVALQHFRDVKRILV